MGAVCCVAVKDKTITTAANSDIVQRNIRHSPTWSFRWDHRGRVAGEETSMTWFTDSVGRNDGPETKPESAYTSAGGSPLENYQRRTSHKSSVSDGATTGHVRTHVSDQPGRRNSSVDASLKQVKELTQSPTMSYPTSAKLSGSSPSTSSKRQLPPASPAPRRPRRHSPQHPKTPGFKSPDQSTMGSYGGSSDGCSVSAFSDHMANSQQDTWSFESESFGFNTMTRASTRIQGSPCIDFQTCGVCSRLLTERSLWSSQKIYASNELSVVAVLICGHAYHAECLERLTPEINKYDPDCLICTFGEKQTRKISEKALKAEMELKARIRKSRNRVVDLDDHPISFDGFKGMKNCGSSPKMASSSSMKSPSGKPFLRKHFSFGAKSSCSESHAPRKKGLFWAKSSKM